MFKLSEQQNLTSRSKYQWAIKMRVFFTIEDHRQGDKCNYEEQRTQDGQDCLPAFVIQVWKEYKGWKQSADQPAHMRHMGCTNGLGCNCDDKVGCEGNNCTATKHRPAHNKATHY